MGKLLFALKCTLLFTVAATAFGAALALATHLLGFWGVPLVLAACLFAVFWSIAPEKA